MSQPEATDLLCRSRREELTPDEQRRLNESLQYSLEVKLMSEILPELERESRVRPGDDLLLARINARVLAPSRLSQRAPAKRRALSMVLVAAAVLLMGGLAAAWIGVAHHQRGAESPAESAQPKPIAKPKPSARFLPSTPALPSELPPDPPSPPPFAPSPSAAARVGAPAPRASAPSSANDLFTRANLLRRQGRAGEAAVLYELLLDQYPNSREVGPSRLALGKYLQATQPERALAQYRAVAAAGGALRAEALWGISEVASSLGDGTTSEQALAGLLREFPDSPYAEVARARALHGRR